MTAGSEGEGCGRSETNGAGESSEGRSGRFGGGRRGRRWWSRHNSGFAFSLLFLGERAIGRGGARPVGETRHCGEGFRGRDAGTRRRGVVVVVRVGEVYDGRLRRKSSCCDIQRTELLRTSNVLSRSRRVGCSVKANRRSTDRLERSRWGGSSLSFCAGSCSGARKRRCLFNIRVLCIGFGSAVLVLAVVHRLRHHQQPFPPATSGRLYTVTRTRPCTRYRSSCAVWSDPHCPSHPQIAETRSCARVATFLVGGKRREFAVTCIA